MLTRASVSLKLIMCLVLVEFCILVSQLCCETSGDLMAALTNVTDDSLPQEQEIL